LELAKYSKNFIQQGRPSLKVLERTKLFHTDSVICGVSALALLTNAPTVLKAEALTYKGSYKTGKSNSGNVAKCFGSDLLCLDTKVIAANCSAVREWDSNGTVFGYRPGDPAFQAGEFGHNDFYPVVIAAAFQNKRVSGREALKAMVLLDEVRCRLAEVFPLKKYKIDHVVHGAIASICTMGALLDASE
jgi:2-methylcitrate dehydratase